MTTDDLDKLVNKFVTEEIALEQEDISDAAKSKEWLLDRIKLKIEEDSEGPQLYSEDPIIGYGSYFAKLKVRDVDEMDFLIVIDSNTGVYTNEGVAYGNGLGSENPNHKYDVHFKKADLSGVSPKALLEWLQNICWQVLKPLGGEMPTIDGPAVKVVLKGSGIKFDLVPAGVFKKVDDSKIFYNIPNGLPNDSWNLTNPRLDLDRVNNLADKFDSFRNVVRLVKYVRDTYDLPISSYAVQCASCIYAEKYKWQFGLFSDFRNALWVLADKLTKGFIEDGYDSSINLLKDQTKLNEIAEQVKAIYIKLDKLLDEPSAEIAYEKLSQILENKTASKHENRFSNQTIAQMLYRN